MRSGACPAWTRGTEGDPEHPCLEKGLTWLNNNLSGETRKVETDRVAVGTVSGEGLSPVFQERAPWSIMDETNKAREHKKA